MRTSTAYNHYRRLSGILAEVYSMARSCASPFDDMLARLKSRVWDDPGLARCPSWVRLKLHTESEIHHRQLYTAILYGVEVDAIMAGKGRPPAFLRWTLRVDGDVVTSEEISRRRAAGDEEIWRRVEGAHVWNHRPDRAFSPWQNTYDTAK